MYLKTEIKMGKLRMTPQQITQNLWHYFTQAGDIEKQEGKVWYNQAQQECQVIADKIGKPLWIVVGVVAALSPRVRWESNIQYAELFLTGYGDSLPIVKDNLRKAAAIANGEHPLTVLGGPKTRAFYQNLMAPDTSECACIDTWMIRAGYSDPKHNGNMSAFEYSTIEAAVIEIAKRVGLVPCQVQACIWLAIRQQGQRRLL